MQVRRDHTMTSSFFPSFWLPELYRAWEAELSLEFVSYSWSAGGGTRLCAISSGVRCTYVDTPTGSSPRQQPDWVVPDREGDRAESSSTPLTTSEASSLGVLLAHNNVGSRGAIVKANKTGLTYLYLRLRSVKAVVARDTTLVLVCCELYE